MFAGRLEEISALEQALLQAKHGNPRHFLVQGERGIGKSSLLLYLQMLADGSMTSLDSTSFRFAVVCIELEPSNSYQDIIRKVGSELQRVIAKAAPTTELAKKAWDFLKRWEVMGVRYTPQTREPQPHELLEELTDSVLKTVDNISSSHDGVLFLIDEADKPPASANLGEFVKVFTERLTKRGCCRFGLVAAGLTGVLNTLTDSHESSPRVFEVISLEPLLPNERKSVIRRGLELANKTNGFEVKALPDGEELISSLSEGYWGAPGRMDTRIVECSMKPEVRFGYREEAAADLLT